MKIIALLISLLLMASPAFSKTGQTSGGETYTIPDWFKLSLLDLVEDSQEAAKNKKHLMLFMHLKACPYCAHMLDDSFRTGSNKQYMQKHFDVIAINVRGDKDVSWLNGENLTETKFSKKIGVIATPTIVFLNAAGKKVLQLNGYRKAKAFRYVLEYVQGNHYLKLGLAEFIRKKHNKPVYQLKSHSLLTPYSNLKGYQQPLAIIFENHDCEECADFHKKSLNHVTVLAEIKKYRFVRLDTYSNKKITTPGGQTLTPARWAKNMGLNYRPGMVLYNKGELISLINGKIYHFHLKENLRYVSGEHFKRYPTFLHYLRVRQKELLSKGFNIDLSE